LKIGIPKIYEEGETPG